VVDGMAKIEPQDKRARILEGALRVLAVKGFYNTRVSEIAREAGVADGTIYNYFKSKDDILISLFEDRMDWILRRLDEELSGDVVAQVRRYIELHLSLATVEPDLAEFITVELRQSDKFLREYKNPPFGDYLRVLANLIERGQEEGVFERGLDPRIASRAIFGALDEILLTLTWRHSGPVDVAMVVDQVTSFVLRGLLKREGAD
jgi:TetR/AcrR family transcriptional regulator, fatty acid metabolism regulator protein